MSVSGREGRDHAGSRGDAPRIAGRFEVLGNLGKGPLGKVYHARDHGDGGREVALKILRATTSSDAGVEDLVTERAGELRTLVHENLNALLDAGQTELGLLFLCSDYVQGENLRALLDRRGALLPEHAFAIARQTLAGLVQAHERGLCHGHLKPENVLLVNRTPSTAENPHGVGVRVLDFGFAELAAGAGAYLAPERRDGAPADPRSDVWALGAMLYEMLTGHRPGPDAPESLGEGISVDAATRDVVARALAADPGERHADASELLAALSELDPGRTPALASTGRPGSKAGSGGGYGGYVGSAAFAILAAAALFLWGRDRREVVNARSALDEARAEIAYLEARPAEADPDATLQRRIAVLENENRELAADIGSWRSRAETAEATAEELANDLAQGESGNEELVADLEGRLQALDDERSTLERRAGTLEIEKRTLTGDRDTWKERAEDAEAREAEQVEEVARLRDLVEETAQERDAALRAFQELELARAREADPELVAAERLDEILGDLEAGRGAEARAAFEELDPSVLGAEAVLLVDHLTAAYAALAASRTADVLPAIAPFREAQALLLEAQVARDAPGVAEAGWMNGIAGDAGNGNLERIDDVLLVVAVDMEARRRRLSADLDELWLAMLAGNPDRDPGDVLAVAGWFDDGRLDGYLVQYAELVRARGEPQGELDVDGLRDVASLGAWARALATEDAGVVSPAVRDVLLFAFALDWHDDGDAEPPALPEVLWLDGAVGTGWRAELVLRARLLAPDSAYPGTAGSRFLYRTTTTNESLEEQVVWRLDTVTPERVPAAGALRSWHVEQRFYRADGTKLTRIDIRVVQQGKTMFQQGARETTLLDLDAGDDRFALGEWRPRQVPRPPAAIPIERDELAAFQRSLRAGPWRCLVLRDGERTTWYSPDFGLVLHEEATRVRSELAFAQVVR